MRHCKIYAWLAISLTVISIPQNIYAETKYIYDAKGRLVEVQEQGATISRYTYDKVDNRKRVVTSWPAVIENGSFEDPVLASYRYGPEAPGLNFQYGAGISVAGDAWGFPAPKHGRQVAFLQSGGGAFGTIWMKATNLTAGKTYRINFSLSQRPGFPTNSVRLYVSNQLIWDAVPGSNQAFATYSSSVFVAQSSSVEVRFSSSPTSDDTGSGLDAVSISQIN